MAEIEYSANQYIYPYIIPNKAFPRLSFLQTKLRPVCSNFTSNFAQLFAINSPYRALLGVTDRPRLFVICGQGASIPIARYVQVKDHVNNSVSSEAQEELKDWLKATDDALAEGTPHAFIAIVDVEIDRDEKCGLTITNKHQVKSFVDNLRLVLSEKVFSEAIMCIKTTGFNVTNNSRQQVIEHVIKAIEGDIEEMVSEFKFRTFLQEEKSLPQMVSRQLEKSLITSINIVFNSLMNNVEMMQRAWMGTSMMDIERYVGTKLSSDGHLKSIDSLIHLDKDLIKHLTTAIEGSQSLKNLLSFLLSSAQKELREKESSHFFKLCHDISTFNANQLTTESATMRFINIVSSNEFQSCLTEVSEGVTKCLQGFRNGISQLENIFGTVLSRLKEDIPFGIQTVFARYEEVRMVTKRDERYEVFIHKNQFEGVARIKKELETALEGLSKGVPVLHLKKFEGDSSIKRFIHSGDKIGHYNPALEKFNFGTMAAVGVLCDFMEKFVFTCDHVAPANNLIYQSENVSIGRSEEKFCIEPHEQYLGTMLDFSAVRLFSSVEVSSFQIKDVNGSYHNHRVYEDSLYKLIGKELFFYGATSNEPKRVRYIGHEACIKEEPHVPASNDEEVEEDAKRILLLSGEGVIPGDSGSLVCYKDEETGDVYSVFILIGGDTQSADLVCCRLADCLDCIQERTDHVFCFHDTENLE